MAHYLVSLRDAMQEFGLAHAPSPPPRGRLPLLQRRAACTHTTLGRLYGLYRCSHCGRVPRCGWVYRCTQDYGGELPPWEAHANPPPSQTDVILANGPSQGNPTLTLGRPESCSADRSPEESEDEGEVELKPWMNAAIAKGEYTEEQIDTLKAQRQRVLDTIREAELAHRLDQTAGRRPLLELASNSAPNLRALKGKKKKGYSGSMRSNVPLKTFPDCQYRTCSTCRPLSKDRAWARIEHANGATGNLTTDLEHDNRPVASAHLAQRLGLRAPVVLIDSPNIPSLPSQDSDLPVLIGVPEPEVSHDRAQDPPPLQPVGIRADLRNTFQPPPPPGQASLSGPQDAGDAAFLQQLADVEALAPQQMPRAFLEAGIDGESGRETEANEVHVRDGVAVTEEAVDLGTADIIMQV